MSRHYQQTESIASETGIQSAYQDTATAVEYVERRFDSELFRLLHERQVAVVNRQIAALVSPRVLEIACGPGRVTRDIRVPPAQLTCLEFNIEMLRVARQVCPAGVGWIRGNAFALPLARPYDLVYSFRFIRHFRRDDRERLYDQIRRVLKPGGILILDAVNAVISGPLREARPEDYPIYDKLYASAAELRDELAAAGFQVQNLQPVQRWFAAQCKAQVMLGPRSRRLCRWTIRSLERLRRGPALEWIVTCRRA